MHLKLLELLHPANKMAPNETGQNPKTIMPTEKIQSEALEQGASEIAKAITAATGKEHAAVMVAAPFTQNPLNGSTQNKGGSGLPTVEITGANREKEKEAVVPKPKTPAQPNVIGDVGESLRRDAKDLFTVERSLGGQDNAYSGVVKGVATVLGRQQKRAQATGGQAVLRKAA